MVGSVRSADRDSTEVDTMTSPPIPGAIYFLVAYLDRALRIPKIETYFCVVAFNTPTALLLQNYGNFDADLMQRSMQNYCKSTAIF
jgi:hypothetical protein